MSEILAVNVKIPQLRDHDEFKALINDYIEEENLFTAMPRSRSSISINCKTAGFSSIKPFLNRELNVLFRRAINWKYPSPIAVVTLNALALVDLSDHLFLEIDSAALKMTLFDSPTLKSSQLFVSSLIQGSR
ncbi:hypothetical protein TNCV_2837981 [Trichonephila clavipes]|nr:hypothetical protein TNCV_2837981 [Trichonephila clavipes]